jgi:sterol desaturase/sphingolipid hydroxylase (fatty acid hydroxylase superfamily)
MEIALYSVITLLILGTILNKSERTHFKNRTTTDWVLDSANLLMHFFIMPFLQVVILYQIFDYLFPDLKSSFDLTFPLALIFYILIDYLWYWNHRTFHLDSPLWRYHKVHHSPSYLDPLMTPRNSILSHFLMVYWWLIGFGVYIAKDPISLISIATIGSMINFWGHSRFDLPDGKFSRFIGLILITPKDHHFHHSKEQPRCNFGTVFSLWDRLHKTLYRNGQYPVQYGFVLKQKYLRQLLLP